MSLIAHYKLDGNANDSVGGYHGSANNVTWATGKLGQCGVFDGTSSIVDFDTFFPTEWSQHFTICAWINIPSSYTWNTSRWSNICARGSYTGSNGLAMSTTNNRVSLWMRSSNGIVTASGMIERDRWHHICGVWKSTHIEFYVDGVQTQSSTVAERDGVPNGGVWSLGRARAFGGSVGSMYTGQVDDVRIYDHALSPREVRDLAQAKVLHYKFDKEDDVTDCSGQDNHGTNVGATWVEDSKIGSGAYRFNGTNTYVECSAANNAFAEESLSAFAWVKPNGDVTGAANILAKRPSNQGWIIHNNSNNRLQTYVHTNGSWKSLITNNVYSPGQWVHVGMTYDGATLTNWVNGVAANSSPVTGSITELAGPITVGAGNYTGSYNQFWNGEIDDARVYHTALSAAEIQEIYQQRASLDSGGSFHVQEIDSNDYIVASEPSRVVTNMFEVLYDVSRDTHFADSYINTVGAAEVEYDFIVDRTDTYTISGYILAVDGGSDSYHMAVDDETFVTWHTGNGPSWTKRTWTTREFSPGIHKLKVRNRETNCKCSIWIIEDSQGKLVKPVKFNLGSNNLKTGIISEVGPADGLVAWYPLQGDTKDYANSNDGTNNGAVATARGYSFDASNPRISIVTKENMSPLSHTISCWLLKTNHNPQSYPIFLSYGLPYIACNGSTSSFRLSYTGPSGQTNVSGSTIPLLNEWYHVVGTFSSDGAKLFINGIHENTNSLLATNTGNSFLLGGHGTGTTYRVEGSISDVRIYNRALSAEEISILYEITNPEINNRMKQSKDCVYIRGEFQEA